MLLRGNVRKVGLGWSGQRYEAQYMLAWRDGSVVGVVGHAWNGMVLVQADEAVAELARATVAESGRAVTGFAGPLEQVVAARAALGLGDAKASLDSDEVLMSLSLDEMKVPAALVDGRARARRASAADRPLLVQWRIGYSVEVLGKVRGPEVEVDAADVIDAALVEERLWVLEDGDARVPMTAFNAVLPDCVQIGGVYTPPALRGRGHARAVVAASLLDARERGARRAVLFTAGADALAAYRAVGFEVTGRFGLVLLA
jgi:GNAT superfamily N-acetyltransferase